MRKALLIIAILSLTKVVNAQIWRGYAKGIGIGTDVWLNTDCKSAFTNPNLSFVFTTFSENTLVCPFISFGCKENGKTYYRRKETNNHTYLWEFGTSVLFQTSDKLHIGPRVGAMLKYNRYESFKDKWRYNVGVEVQYNFNSNYKSIANNAIYLNINVRSVGIGYRYYFF